MTKYIKFFLFAFAVSFLITPVVRKLAIKIGAIDIPKDDRRMHKDAVPLLGGLAIFVSILVSVLLFRNPMTKEMQGIIIGASIIVISGVIDDIKGLSPLMKVIFQMIAAIVVMYGGVRIEYISNFFGETGSVINLGFFGIPITLLWIIGITNALNLIDGLDGLADGISGIAAMTLAIISIMFEIEDIGTVSMIIAGACFGFLPYNFHPAKIFMGDTGALLLGFLFSVITIEGVLKTAATVAVVVPVLVLAIPISDTFFAIIRRTLSGKSFTTADKGHLHHRLIQMGFSHKKTVLLMYLFTAIMGVFAILVSIIGGLAGNILAIAIIILIVAGARRIGMFSQPEEQEEK